MRKPKQKAPATAHLAKPTPHAAITLDGFRAKATERVESRYRCIIDVYMVGRHASERGAFAGALKDHAITPSDIAAVLRENGCTVSSTVVYEHRRKGCRHCRIQPSTP
jgi:hypothetical protein